MADNIDFLLDKLYPGKKIIAWAHNAHVMHDRGSMKDVDGSGLYPQSMGSYVSSRHRNELYSIGLFMYRGQAADNGRAIYPVQPPLPQSLEAVMYQTRKMWTFVDMLGQSRSAGTSWMFDPIPIKEWGKNDYRFIPRNQFDGILFIDTVNPPQYYVPKTPRG
jgi:erythromycin esterase